MSEEFETALAYLLRKEEIPEQLKKNERYDPWNVQKERYRLEIVKADESVRDHAKGRLGRIGAFVVIVVIVFIIVAVYVNLVAMKH